MKVLVVRGYAVAMVCVTLNGTVAMYMGRRMVPQCMNGYYSVPDGKLNGICAKACGKSDNRRH